jgi:hypothetical protein
MDRKNETLVEAARWWIRCRESARASEKLRRELSTGEIITVRLEPHQRLSDQIFASAIEELRKRAKVGRPFPYWDLEMIVGGEAYCEESPGSALPVGMIVQTAIWMRLWTTRVSTGHEELLRRPKSTAEDSETTAPSRSRLFLRIGCVLAEVFFVDPQSSPSQPGAGVAVRLARQCSLPPSCHCCCCSEYKTSNTE